MVDDDTSTGAETTAGDRAGPDNVVVVLLDSLNRHLLGAYGSDEFTTPNLDAFAARSVRFTEHHTGSLPCMPARHDILCGALDFLWKPWGSIELWEESITATLRREKGHDIDAACGQLRRKEQEKALVARDA